MQTKNKQPGDNCAHFAGGEGEITRPETAAATAGESPAAVSTDAAAATAAVSADATTAPAAAVSATAATAATAAVSTPATTAPAAAAHSAPAAPAATDAPAQISPLACVEPGAQIAPGCVIEPFAHISAQAVLGPGCTVHSGAAIRGRTTLGAGCTVHSHAVLGGLPQDVSYQPGDFAALQIGAGSTIREFATINCGTAKGDGITRVGAGCFVMAYAHIAHDCCVGDGVILANGVTLAGHVQVGERSVIGGLTPVHQFVRIGKFCMLAGASALSQDLPDFCLAEGNRASVRSLNLVGLRRNFSAEQIEPLRAAYKQLFRASSGDLQARAREILAATQSELVKDLCEFILSSKRGINIFNKEIDEK